MGHVRPLIPLMETHDIIKIAQRIVKEGLSVRAVEKLVKKPEPKPKVKKDLSKYDYATELLEKKTQTKVLIDDHKIQIYHHGDDDLNRILDALKIIEEE
jgi:ParB family chromosome partitioning protein